MLSGFKDRFDVTIWEGYGLTETSPALTSTAIGGVPKPNCVGRPLPGVEIKLIDEDGDEVEDEGDPGEIVVRGPNVFSRLLEPSGGVDGRVHRGRMVPVR